MSAELVTFPDDYVTDGRLTRKGEFPGLLGLVNAYVNSLNVDVATKCDIRKYLNLIKDRASGMTGCLQSTLHSLIDGCVIPGKLITPATWIRSFITSHPEYKHDSVVSEVINYDLLRAIDEM
jgi:glutamate--cysteine ligase catalytic subunit